MNEAYLGDRAQARLAGPPRAADGLPHSPGQPGEHLARARGAAGQDGHAAGGAHRRGPATEERSAASRSVFVSREQRRGCNTLLEPASACTPGATRSPRSPPAARAPTCACRPRRRRRRGGRSRDLIRAGDVPQLLIQEWINPATGSGRPRPAQAPAAHACSRARRAPRRCRTRSRTTGSCACSWRRTDALQRDYCFTIHCAAGSVEDVSLFHGNLVRCIPRPRTIRCASANRAPCSRRRRVPLRAERHRRRPRQPALRHDLPAAGGACGDADTPGARAELQALAYRTRRRAATSRRSRRCGRGRRRRAAARDRGTSRSSLVHSDDSAESGDHFVVETDERQRSVLRFGNGTNGQLLPDDAIVHCRRTRSAAARAGNVGADSYRASRRALDRCSTGATRSGTRSTSPTAATPSRAPRTSAARARGLPRPAAARGHARRLRAPRRGSCRASRARPRATPGRAAGAPCAWRSTRRARPCSSDALRSDVAAHLDAVRLIGEDLEIRPPRFVPLASTSLCADAGVLAARTCASCSSRNSPTATRPTAGAASSIPTSGRSARRCTRSADRRPHPAVAGVEHVIVRSRMKRSATRRRTCPAPSESSEMRLRRNHLGAPTTPTTSSAARSASTSRADGNERSRWHAMRLLADPFTLPDAAVQPARRCRASPTASARYADFREAMLRGLNAAPALAGVDAPRPRRPRHRAARGRGHPRRHPHASTRSSTPTRPICAPRLARERRRAGARCSAIA